MGREEDILRALFDIHESLLNSTVTMKDPNDLAILLEKFSVLSSELNDYLEGRTISTSSPELSKITSVIGNPSTLSPEAKTNCSTWIIMMFETYPTVINISHFENLMKNAETLTDGSTEAEAEDAENL
jgi:hypothetical protein